MLILGIKMPGNDKVAPVQLDFSARGGYNDIVGGVSPGTSCSALVLAHRGGLNFRYIFLTIDNIIIGC